ncbi:hypothetical protein [Nostoc sp. FACHB-888]|uniref:hypothetical protein n=1 Tax=Nostoc sp. FACHB-888 TaxID=2692842 RepID=UPI00168838D6|nr:hypothetical protein [Nostoc sp. FACHB-888]MBD2247974.1 hypothetical protein [Nostoc sp. FACHB-888]
MLDWLVIITLNAQVICDACGGLRLRLREYIRIHSLETVKNLLQLLEKPKRAYLTAVEEKLLSLVEYEYGGDII